MSTSFIISGCREGGIQSELVEINIEENVDNFKPISICDFNCEIRYIPLETDSIFLKVASLSAFNKEFILVTDYSRCMLYGVAGNFISEIGKIGKGPGEFISIEKMQFGPDNNIYINDGSFLSVFDRNGKFLHKFKPQANPDDTRSGSCISSFALFNDSLFIGQIRNDSGHEKFKAVFFNKEGQTIKLVENHNLINMIRPYITTANGAVNIYRNGKSMFIKERFNDTVFRIGDQYQFIPAYHINLGNFRLPNEVRELPLSEFQKKGRNYIEVRSFFETSNFCILSCSFGTHDPIKDRRNLNLPGTYPYWGWATLGVFEKERDELVFAKVNTTGTFLTITGLDNDYDGGISFFPYNQVNDSTLSMWVDVYLLKEHIASDYFKKSTPKYPEKKKELEAFVNRLNENDNPVLILCTFK